MAQASIPVDLFNPGQVFACLGFLEAAEILMGDAEGGFDWRDEAATRFSLRVSGDKNPFAVVLEFLVNSNVIVITPEKIDGPWPIGAQPSQTFPAPLKSLKKSDGKALTDSALPIELRRGSDIIPVSHWLNDGSRETIKLFAGQQVGANLAVNMLRGDSKKKNSKGLKDIYRNIEIQNFTNPFDEICAVGGRFGFDARGGWDAIRAGTSIDQQGVLVKVAPHVEILAAIGLENARPNSLSTYQISYSVWGAMLPISLCRVALCSAKSFLPKSEFRLFRTHLGDDKQYKKVFFAEEETP